MHACILSIMGRLRPNTPCNIAFNAPTNTPSNITISSHLPSPPSLSSFHRPPFIAGRIFDMYREYTKRASGYGEILGQRGGINITSFRSFFEERGGSPRGQPREEEPKLSTTSYLSDINNNRWMLIIHTIFNLPL